MLEPCPLFNLKLFVDRGNEKCKISGSEQYLFSLTLFVFILLYSLNLRSFLSQTSDLKNILKDILFEHTIESNFPISTLSRSLSFIPLYCNHNTHCYPKLMLFFIICLLSVSTPPILHSKIRITLNQTRTLFFQVTIIDPASAKLPAT